MGMNVLSNSTQGTREVRVPVSTAVTVGDLLLNTEGATAKKASDLLTVTQLNNTTAGPSVVYPVTITGTNYGSTSSNFKRLCEIDSGNILEVYTGNGTGTAIGVNLVLRNAVGAILSVPVVVSSTPACECSRIKRLSSTKVLIAWTESSTLKFAIYNNDGTVATAPATVSTISGPGEQYWNMSVLVGGDIVFAYSKATPFDACFKRYNSTGVLQGSETVVEAAASGSSFCVKELAAGGFIVYYFRSAATYNWKFARYNSTGVIQGTLTTIANSSTVTKAKCEFDDLVLELSGGNLLFQYIHTASLSGIVVYDSTGTLVATTTPAPATEAVAGASNTLVEIPGGFVSITGGSSGKSNIRFFAANGIQLYPSKATTETNLITAGYGGGAILVVPTVSGYVVVSNFNDGANGNFQLFTLSKTGDLIGSVVVIPSGAPSTSISLLAHSSGLLMLSWKYTTQFMMAVYNPTRTSILGVAQETVSSGALCRVATSDTHQINQVFSTSGNFDQRTATVPGAKGSIVGSTAVLYGME